MPTDAPITGFSHVQLLVADVATSEQWYSTALGMRRLTAGEGDSYVALRHPPSRVVVVLTPRDPGASTPTGGTLDHLAFTVPDGTVLEAWAKRLTAQGITNGGVVDELGNPSLILTDPDGTRIELVAPPGTFAPSTDRA